MTSALPPPLIAHVIYHFGVGGLENGVVNLLNRLPASRWRHAVIALTQVTPAMQARVTRPDVTCVALEKGPGHLYPHYPRLYRLFRELRPAIVHTRNLAALEAVVPARLARALAIVHGEHGRDASDLDGHNVRNLWTRRLYSPFVSRFVALSSELQRYLTERVGIAPTRITQLCNGVDSAQFTPRGKERAAIAGCLFTDPRQFLVGTVGRLDTVKDQSNLARAFVAALRRRPAARDRLRLVIVGDGALREEVQQILAAGDAAQHAWLAGERHDVADVLRGLDCFVLPSLAEGVSNTILEAMATGLPVIATDVGGNPELVVAGRTGTLVRAGHPEALARSILACAADPVAARTAGRAGRQRAEREFSIDAMVRRYLELYDRLLTVDAARPARGAAA